MPQNTPCVRQATPADAPGLCAVLNAIITAGGTTAMETPLDVDGFIAAFLRCAQAAGLTAINATIRADNVGGLAYYTRMGFQPHAVQKGVPLADGTPADRVSKRLALA